MKTKHIIFALLLTLTLPVWYGCSDEDEPSVTDNKVEEIEGFRLSSFASELIRWRLGETGENYRIILHSHANNELYDFGLKVSTSGAKSVFTMYIPDHSTLPDGEYDAIALSSEGTTIGPRMYFKISQMVVEQIAMREGKFKLRGHGTQESPYIISSKSDFEEFEIGLCEEGNSNGFGLFFEQTASFDVPPRSQIIMGTYHACESFAGNYNGGGYTVNVPYTGSATEGNDSNIGLFKELLPGATIHDLTINALMQGIHDNGGALAGKSSGNVTIANVNVEGSINSDNHTNIGGFIGYVAGDITFTDCNLTAFVQGNNAVGGIIGRFAGGTLTINDFANSKTEKDKLGNVKEYYSPFSVSATADNAGGLVGYVDAGSTINVEDITLLHSVQAEDGSVKAVSADGSNVGGLFGSLNSVASCTIEDVLINAPVYGGNNVGGMMGYVNLAADISMEKCVFSSVAGGKDCVGGFFGKINGNKFLIRFEGSDKTSSVKQTDNALVKVTGVSNVGGFVGRLNGADFSGSKFYINTGVSCTGNNVGGICGILESTTLHSERFVLSNSMHISGPQNIGGIVGYAKSSTITGSAHLDKKLQDYNDIPAASSFESSFAGTVGDGTNATCVGGIVGTAENSVLRDICFTGTLVGSQNVGGIVGMMVNGNSGQLYNCFNNSQKITNKSSSCTAGIVGYIKFSSASSFENLINYADVEGSDKTGGVFGYVEYISPNSDFALANAVNAGNITGSGNTGGLIANLYDHKFYYKLHKIDYCANYGNVSNSGGGNVGGIIGHFNCTLAVVMHCANHGNIKGSGNDVMVGGIAGRMGTNDASDVNTERNMELSYSCNFGEISSDTGQSHVGGLLGYQEQGSPTDDTHYMLHNCYNMGAVPSDQKDDNGGILGYIDHHGEIQNCINVGKVSHGNGCVGTHKDGGIFYHHNLYYLKDSGKGWCADDFKDGDKGNSSTFKGLDFTNVWMIDDNNSNSGYPYLRDCPFQFKKQTK